VEEGEAEEFDLVFVASWSMSAFKFASGITSLRQNARASKRRQSYDDKSTFLTPGAAPD